MIVQTTPPYPASAILDALPDPATDIAGGWITLADLRERMDWPTSGPEIVSVVRALQAAQHVECRGGWERTFIVRKKA